MKKETKRFTIPRWIALPLYILISPLSLLAIPLGIVFVLLAFLILISSLSILVMLNLPSDSRGQDNAFKPVSAVVSTLSLLAGALMLPLIYLEQFAFPVTDRYGGTHGSRRKSDNGPLFFAMGSGLVVVFFAFLLISARSEQTAPPPDIRSELPSDPAISDPATSDQPEFAAEQIAQLATYQLNQSLTQLDPAQSLTVQLIWNPVDVFDQGARFGDTYQDIDYHVRVELYDDRYLLIARSEQEPTNQAGKIYPTSLWRIGYKITDYHRLSLPPHLNPTAEYTLHVGLYDRSTGEYLPTLESTDDRKLP